jgi:uncharacterized cupredoxin-like copper-binding protein
MLVSADQVPEGAEVAPGPGEEQEDAGAAAATPEPAASPSGGMVEPNASAEVVTIEGVDIDWNPNEVTIPANTDVTFSIPNNGVTFHTFVIPEYDIKLNMEPGSVQEVTVNLPPGRYDFICDVPGHAEAGMVGTIIVE